MRRALLLVAAACNQFFDIDRTAPAPTDAVDGDLDGTPDASDNCPAIANPTQTDLDADGPGDACDNCPLVANSGQADEADRDGVGDQCDPHPEDAGDCLVLIDSFSDASLLAEHWRIEGVGTATPQQAGGVVLESPPGARLRWIALDPSGAPLAGSFDVQARIRATFVAPDASIELISNAPDATTGLGCSVDQSGASQLAVARVRQPTSTLAGFTLGFSSAPLGDDLLLRLSTTSDGMPDIRCRADFGIAVGFSAVRDAHSIAQIPELPPGPAGVSVVGQAFVLDAFALYRFQPGVECTPTVMR